MTAWLRRPIRDTFLCVRMCWAMCFCDLAFKITIMRWQSVDNDFAVQSKGTFFTVLCIKMVKITNMLFNSHVTFLPFLAFLGRARWMEGNTCLLFLKKVCLKRICSQEANSFFLEHKDFSRKCLAYRETSSKSQKLSLLAKMAKTTRCIPWGFISAYTSESQFYMEFFKSYFKSYPQLSQYQQIHKSRHFFSMPKLVLTLLLY